MSEADLITFAVFMAVLALIYGVGIRLVSRSNLRAEFDKAISAPPGADEPPPPVLINEEPFRPRRRAGTSRFRRARAPLKDGGQQLSAVLAASFQKQRVMNRSEFNVFKVIEEDVISARKGYRVFAQVNLGEIMQSVNDDADRSAFRSINSKRVDMLIADQGGWPVLAIEYQGAGHYQDDAAMRDAVKKNALNKAGVGYLEIFPSDSPQDIRDRVREHLGWNTEHKPDPAPREAVTAPEPAAHFGRAHAGRT